MEDDDDDDDDDDESEAVETIDEPGMSPALSPRQGATPVVYLSIMCECMRGPVHSDEQLRKTHHEIKSLVQLKERL